MKQRSNRSLPCIISLTLSGVSAIATAQTPILDFTGGFQSQIGAPGNTVGYSFNVSSNITIRGLGVFDWNSDGLLSKIPVGIWNTAGPTLLANSTLDNTSTVVASTSANGRWLENSIPALTLTPGNYVIGAYYVNAGDFFADVAAIPTTITGVNYGVPLYTTTNSFSYPNIFNPLDPTGGFFGPTAFLDAKGSNVPEPGSMALLVALGLTGVALLRRRRTR